MKIIVAIVMVLGLIMAWQVVFGEGRDMTYNELTGEEKLVIIDKGTEKPFSGKYLKHSAKGVYACRQCGTELYRSEFKFDSDCGWPAFDDEIDGAVRHTPDADGRRIEVTCANCNGHLGHVFAGEELTDKNIRHCVNSISLAFVPAAKTQTKSNQPKISNAFFAGGCFWGVEYWLKKTAGVIAVRSGYMGGNVKEPTYEQICTGSTGHAETVEVEYNPAKVSFAELTKLFFEIHDPTQRHRQGPDVGDQYRSAIFYTDAKQKKSAERLIELLRDNGFDVVTEVTKAGQFWPAEEYHQDYYGRTGKVPYCHSPMKRF